MPRFRTRYPLVTSALVAALISVTSPRAHADAKTLNHALDIPLGNAIMDGKTDEVKKLLDQGADPNAVSTDDSKTPMLTVAAAVDVPLDIAKLLITAGANLEAPTTRGDSPLGVAAMKGHLDVANLLVKSGAKLESNQDLGLTPLIFAAATGHTEVVRALIKAGANVNARAKDGGSALVYNSTKTEAGAGNLETAKMLVEAGADVSYEAGDVDAKKLAEKNGMTDIVKYLGTIARRDEDLLQAVSAGHWAEAKKMLAHGANPRYETRFYENEGDDVGTVAAAALVIDVKKSGFDEATALQVLKGCDLEVKDDQGDTALMNTVNTFEPNPIKLRLLLSAGASTETPNKDGETPLILAAQRDEVEAMQLLIQAKANLEATSPKTGKTALMFAAEFGAAPGVKVLLDAGAKWDAKIPAGDTALSLAEAKQKTGYVLGADYPAVIKMLQAAAPEEELPGLDELTK